MRSLFDSRLPQITLDENSTASCIAFSVKRGESRYLWQDYIVIILLPLVPQSSVWNRSKDITTFENLCTRNRTSCLAKFSRTVLLEEGDSKVFNDLGRVMGSIAHTYYESAEKLSALLPAT